MNHPLHTAPRAVLAGSESTVLPVANNGRLQETMERPLADEARPADPVAVPAGCHVIRYNDDGEFGQATGWLHREGGEPCVVTGKPVYVWRPINALLATTGHKVVNLAAAPAAPAASAEPVAATDTPNKSDNLSMQEALSIVRRFERMVADYNALHAEYQGKPMDEWTYKRFTALRDERIPDARRELAAMLAAPAAPAAPVPPVVADVLAELAKAVAKFPTWPTDPLHALAVLGEEFGKLTKEVVQLCYEPHKTTPQSAHKEAMQTAAMALRFAMSLARYEYRPGPQHAQGEA